MSTSSSSPVPRGAAQWALIFLFAIVSITLAIGGYRYYRQQEQAIRTERYGELKAIAELKIDQIIQWRQERLNDAYLNATGIVREYVMQLQQSPADTALRARLLARLQTYAKQENYQNIILAGADGRLLLSLDPSVTTLEAPAQQLALQAVAAGQPVFGDLSRCPACDQVHLDVAAPILDEDGRPVAVLIQRTDPEQYLYPLIQAWPMPNQSAETLLARRDGENALFLNTLRHRPDPPLTLRIPLTELNVPVVQAALGLTGEFQGRDYRGVEVLAEILPVPGTPWFMIAKVDTSEILAEVHYRGQMILLLVALVIVMTGAMAAYIYAYRQRRLAEALLRAGQARWKAQEETRTTLYSIGDGVITTDAAGRITRMNPVAEALTGWREAAALKHPLTSVFHIINERTRAEAEDPVARVLRDGQVVGLANHTLLIARDGTERPIADSGAPIRDEKGQVTGVVLVFRDQTKERAEQKERALLAEIIDASINEIYIFDAGTLRFRYANKSALLNLGYSPEQLKQLTPLDLRPELTLASFQQVVQPLVERQKSRLVFETVQRRSDGSLYPVEVHLQMFDYGGDRVFLAVIQDITERRRTEEALRHSEERFRAIFEQAAVGIAQVSADGRYLRLNQRFCDITGYSQDEMLACSFETITHPDDLAANLESVRRALAGEFETFSLEMRYIRKDRSPVWVNLTVSLVREPVGEPDYFIVVAEDISARKEAEAQLMERLEELRRWHDATLGREARIFDLKREVNELLVQAGQPPRYPSAEGISHD